MTKHHRWVGLWRELHEALGADPRYGRDNTEFQGAWRSPSASMLAPTDPRLYPTCRTMGLDVTRILAQPGYQAACRVSAFSRARQRHHGPA